ncbi:hypothetical protein KM295_13770 [Natronomonas sp. F2-12]|uniref:DUF8139 domain-containing protein n=1 Tax=Natronomonas aquatica TaxID=2841590 RepID=A0A9R1CSH9_9EURY|nr:hypothetical protein [Natronomonas aquatica]MCQ4334523.1 hypothetical protein [Natronomonas aquatica]
MEDIPQPSSEPYASGDRVRVYVSSDDPDSQHHDLTVEIIDVLRDDLNSETGRDLDAYYYSVRDIETEEILPVQFRHHDLIPES